MKKTLARFLFNPLFASFLLLPLGPLSGCQPAPDESVKIPLRDPLAWPACVSLTSWCYKVGDFHPASAVDYLELRSRDDGSKAGDCVADSIGTKCEKATDPRKCKEALLSIEPAWAYLRSEYLTLYTTAGDRVQSVSLLRDSLSPFLVPIDSAQEAAFLASGAGYFVDCAAPMDQVVSSVPGGYEVIGTTGSACGPGQDVYRHKLLIGPDGSITDEQSELIKKTDVSCIVD